MASPSSVTLRVPPSPVRGKARTLAVTQLHSSLDRRTDKPSPLAGEGRLPLSGGDVERSETERVGRLAEGQTDEGERVWRISCFLNGVHIIFPQMSAIMWMQSKCQRINNTQNAHTQKTSEEFSTLRKFFRISLSRGIQQGSFLTFFLDQRHRNGQLVQLLLVHHIGTLGHRLTGVLHLGERNHIPDRIRAGHQHH